MTTRSMALQHSPSGMAARSLTLAYGLGVYAFFFGTFLYLIGFVGGWVVPKTIDSGTPAASTAAAVVINVLLLGIFAIQHTIMARPAFKRWWTQYVPWQIERSTFVLITSLILAFMAWQWRPLPAVVWSVENDFFAALLTGVSLAGWGVVLVSTFLIDHFELFGLRQTVQYALQREVDAPAFRERLFYRWMRHPLMVGFIIAFWSTPVMTQGHLLFAAVTTAYIIAAVRIEEATLVYLHGDRYRDYQRRVPMFFPFSLRRTA